MADIDLIIKIPDHLYKLLKDFPSDSNEGRIENVLMKAVENGTPIPYNATVGEVFCILACKEPICETASYFTIDKNLWNAPYQKDR